jgi:hypothetical protein
MKPKTQDAIRTFKGYVIVDFVKRGEHYTLNVPHYRKWRKLISFLENRGFSITENPHFKKQYAILSKYHKIGYKKDVACLLEIGAARITIRFGHIKNLWKVRTTSFWDWPSDDRYTHLTYIESLAVKLEIEKTINFFKKYKMPLTIQDEKLSPEEEIIKGNRNNTHIHGVVNCLNDIKMSIKEDSYNYLHNSNDKNKKKLISGDKKYFYHPVTNRLSSGIVWHHISNMWWVIFGNELRNIVCWEFFDYDPNLPRRKPVDVNDVNRLLKNFESKKEYRRCDAIHKHHKHLFKKETETTAAAA